MLDLPRVVGVCILLTGVLLQALRVDEIKKERVSKVEERQYLTRTIFPHARKDELLGIGGSLQ
jgi:hypothetical protein